ncbi:MAG: hypothetical protein KDI75_03690, partial [Xanthomonadales bacterium]|nr:hypothetical protein [Xanthomonadales bacterium]
TRLRYTPLDQNRLGRTFRTAKAAGKARNSNASAPARQREETFDSRRRRLLSRFLVGTLIEETGVLTARKHHHPSTMRMIGCMTKAIAAGQTPITLLAACLDVSAPTAPRTDGGGGGYLISVALERPPLS